MGTLQYHEYKGNIFNYLNNAVLIQCIASNLQPLTLLDQALESRYHNYEFIKRKYPNLVWNGREEVIETPGAINFLIKQHPKEQVAVDRFERCLIQMCLSPDRPSRVVINRRSINNFYDWQGWSNFANTIRETCGNFDMEAIVFYETELMNLEIRDIIPPGMDVDYELHKLKLQETGLNKVFF